MNNFQKIMKNNQDWSKRKLSEDPNYFKRHAQSQSPKYLFIGCSDSRIPAQTILGLEPGQIFVHRNIANQVEVSDINTLSVIQYAVQVLKVQDIIIVGHYGCGGVKAACTRHDFGPLQSWLSHIRTTRISFQKLLNKSQDENFNLLCELNVKTQVYDTAKIPCVQKAWLNGQQLRIHGLIYRLDNGALKDLGLTLDRMNQIPEQHWVHNPINFNKSCNNTQSQNNAFKKNNQKVQRELSSKRHRKQSQSTQAISKIQLQQQSRLIKSGNEKQKGLQSYVPLILAAGVGLYYGYKKVFGQ